MLICSGRCRSSKRRTRIKGNRSWCIIYKLRAFRRETLFWINLLNKVSTLLSISLMSNSSASNCSSWHAILAFWKALDTRDHLLEFGITICFNKRCNEDSSIEIATSLASADSLSTLHPS
ncbi:hypothetical protein DAI22_08g244100 [Oryza sativa Japonica Group]|nr:hypothetical protein DAI22_08g244100 [Oryza sativa Japonica Group]